RTQLEQKQTNHQEIESQLTTLAISSGLLTQMPERTSPKRARSPAELPTTKELFRTNR
ncbi:7498_t:CDS:2, partial [Diversispora eburnea]